MMSSPYTLYWSSFLDHSELLFLQSFQLCCISDLWEKEPVSTGKTSTSTIRMQEDPHPFLFQRTVKNLPFGQLLPSSGSPLLSFSALLPSSFAPDDRVVR